MPCAVVLVGAEEIHRMIGSMNWLGKPIGLPYLPITPTFPALGPLGFVPASDQVVDRVRGAGADRGARIG